LIGVNGGLARVGDSRGAAESRLDPAWARRHQASSDRPTDTAPKKISLSTSHFLADARPGGRPAEEHIMQASDIMTTEIVTVTADTPLQAIAGMLLARGISAVPVVDAAGAAIGMVSEGDLLGRDDAAREARRDWWLALLAEGEALHPEVEASIRTDSRTARDVMSTPVVTVTETAAPREIARLLAAYHIKRVPVVRDGRVVGIVSRADVLRAYASERTATSSPRHHSTLYELAGGALVKLDERFGHRQERSTLPSSTQSTSEQARALVSAEAFQDLVSDFERHKAEIRRNAQIAVAEQRRRTVRTLVDEHVGDARWRALLDEAKHAATRGEKEFMLLRFPSDLCSDGGRAINAPLPDWPATLRGEAAETFLRWQRELRPLGFHLSAHVLDFPGGKPGDIGLFLGWAS
jgi:CBS domain-containing protein